MKRIYPVLFVLAASLALVSCREEVLDPVSVITLDQRTQNDFDKWLDANYVTPYNILVKYRYESNESDLNYWTIPARLDCSIVMAHLVKYLCIDTYDEVGGVRFTQKRNSSTSASGSTRTTVPTSWVPPKAARRSSCPA